MTIRFYDNPKDGVLHFSATAGGGNESGQTSAFDVPATPALIAKHRKEYDAYILAKEKKLTDPGSQQTLIQHLETALAAAQRDNERLSMELTALKSAQAS